MTYYMDCVESQHGEGIVYYEVDHDQDIVTRQVEVYGDLMLWGDRTAAETCQICDQNASCLEFTAEHIISRDEFKAAWARAKGRP